MKCPIFSIGRDTSQFQDHSVEFCNCVGNNCGWWVEGKTFAGCSITALATVVLKVKDEEEGK